MSSIPAAGFGLSGALLVVLALPAAGRLDGLPRALALVAVVLAVLAGATAVLVNLRAADRTPRLRALLVAVAGTLLMAATVLTGSAAVAVLADDPAPAGGAAGDGLTVVISGVGEDARLTMRAEMPDIAAGDLVRAEVTVALDGENRTVLARQLTVARGTGSVPVELSAPAVGTYDMLQILVESPHRRCTANVRPQVSEAPVASCKAR
ncbi:hypothetical protein [Actinoplanes sp. NPDC049599]|uniref:hypothetical protein n=1 Tax=Actinoplanes sp. NPDC049599 TaxID=3363903 RepID=UPI003796D529